MVKQASSVLFLCLFSASLMVFGWSASAQQLFLSPNKKHKEESSESSPSYFPQLFITKKKPKKKKNFTQYDKDEIEKKQKMIVQNIKEIPLESDYDFAKLYAEYKGAEELNADLFEPGGAVPMSADELKKLSAVKKMPNILSMLEQQEKNSEYIAAYMNSDNKPIKKRQDAYEPNNNANTYNASQDQVKPTLPYIFNAPGKPKKPVGVFTKY
jgi:hypothetical protein